jgi:hypothetical protein
VVRVWRTDQKSVEVAAILRGKNEALTPSGRAAVPIVARCRLEVVALSQPQRPLILKAEALTEEIFDRPEIELVRVLDDPEARIVPGMTAVGRGADVAGVGRRGHAADGTDQTTAAEIADLAVPGALAGGASACAPV